MRKILSHRGLRLIFIANMISMLGSGLNSAAVIWYILQKTHSEVDISYLVVFQTLPAMLLIPFTGVFIDREDRRRLVMLLDAGRGLVILVVAILALRHQVELWHLYIMNTLVALGFWMFWPTITALIQELTPDTEFVHSNTFLMAGVQGGWLIAGAIVGFLYDHIGLGPILLIDFGTYVVSFTLYLFVRKGRHVVSHPPAPDAPVHESTFAHYVHDLKEGFRYVRARPVVIALCTSWGLFLGAMLSQTILTAPFSERILHGGAVGYGWLNGAWGVGAFLSALYAAKLIERFGGRAVVGVGMAALTFGMAGSPFSGIVLIGVLFYFIMGTARGLLGIALSSTTMEIVPKHMMGRVQNTYYFAGVLLQIVLGLAVGITAHNWSLTAAFYLIGSVYGIAFLLSTLPARAATAGETTGTA
ncbi:MAG: MFS transporter [Acidobacteriales bacterium]|nr:MFS transporter [Terriglobales bacterium]